MPKVLKGSYAKPIPAGAVYIGRPSAWGNPYEMRDVRDELERADVIAKFEDYARAKLLNEPTWLEPLIGKDLSCFCAPKACHGDVLLRLIDEIYGKQPVDQLSIFEE